MLNANHVLMHGKNSQKTFFNHIFFLNISGTARARMTK